MCDGANLCAHLEAESSCFLFWLRPLPRRKGISEEHVPCCASNFISGSDPPLQPLDPIAYGPFTPHRPWLEAAPEQRSLVAQRLASPIPSVLQGSLLPFSCLLCGQPGIQT